MRKISQIALSIAFAFPVFSSFSFDERSVFNPKGQAVFKVRFFGVGDGPYYFYPIDGVTNNLMPEPWDQSTPRPMQPTWNLDEREKKTILSAMAYWAEVIQPAKGVSPAIINTGTNPESLSRYNYKVSGGTALAKHLQGLPVVDAELNVGAHGMFTVDQLAWSDLDHTPLHLPPPSQNTSLYAIPIHELGHALGILGTEDVVTDRKRQVRPFFNQLLSTWEQHLRDDHGNPAQPGQKILCVLCLNPYDDKAFDARKDQAYFAGDHVNEVLAGSFGEAVLGKPRGVPVKLLRLDLPEVEYLFKKFGNAMRLILISKEVMAHPELKNSLMGSQGYRNTTTFMEAELAVLQDLGYTIDRRNFYGYSVYGDGQTMVNDHGFFQRDISGSTYLRGQYNTATLGMGLHIYGSYNVITQAADLLSQGAGGAGVRIDGIGNTLVIAPGTRIHAHGLNGRGVMVAYGKNHTLIHRGEIQASGADGIAASFDFGNNALGSKSEYRGSYIHTELYPMQQILGRQAFLGELDGPLVRQFDVTGRLSGQSAAIYMSENALAGQINIMRGAQLTGDIISRYNERDEQGQPRLTQLTFGQLADVQGQSTGQADPLFLLSYQGNIQGISNLALSAQGGVAALNGQHQLYSVSIAPGATLAGNGRYTINDAGYFTNQGTLSPGNSIGQIDIVGSYHQTASGRLLMEVDGVGRHDVLNIDGAANLNGQLTIAPQRDWYANSWNAAVLKAKKISGTFASVNSLTNSPTLIWSAKPTNDGSYQLAMSRPNNAYSQYAKDANSQQVGGVLDRLTDFAHADMQQLYRALDFSAADGSAVSAALTQLSPAVYSTLLTQNLEREQQISDFINARVFLTPSATLSVENEEMGVWRGFASAFGGRSKQSNQNTMMAYSASQFGAVFGAEKQSADHTNWVWGFHGAASTQSVHSDTSGSAKGESMAFHLGLHTRYAANPQSGAYFFGHGRLGVENDKMERSIRIQDYADTHEASWTAWSGSLALGGGYRWAVNEALSVGPIAILDYTLLTRPGVSESGRDARLGIASQRFHSLRSSVGVQANVHLGSTLKAHMTMSWDRAHLSDTLTQDAYFVAYQNNRFQDQHAVTWRDALRLQGGVTYQANKKLTLGTNVSSHFFRAGYHDINGSLFMTRRF